MHKYIFITIIVSMGMFPGTMNFAATLPNTSLQTGERRIQPRFAIYTAELAGKDLNKTKLLEPPLLTGKDIVAYEWTDHSMKITPEATARLAKILKTNTSGVPFMVVIRGRRCYAAYFWWSISSVETFAPVIIADSLLTAKGSATLRFQDGYPTSGLRRKASGRSPMIRDKIPVYENNSIRNALIQSRKLTENGLIVIPGGYRSPYRRDEYRTCLTNADQAKSNAAYQKIYHRYGREDYATLRDELLKSEPAFTLSGEFLAVIRIFHEAKDPDALIAALNRLNPQVIRDSETWNRINETIAWDGIKVYQAFIMACKPEIYRPNYFSSFQNKYLELLNSGKAGKAERTAIEKMVDLEPELFARFCKPLNRDENALQKNLNAELAAGRKSAAERRRNIGRMLSFIRYYTNFNKFRLSDYPELKKFVSLLDQNDEQEVFDYISAAGMLGMYNEAADLLIRRIDLPVSNYEMHMVTAPCQRLMTRKEEQNSVVEHRRGQLIDFLLKAKRAKEAQAWAEKFYGADADPDPNKVRFISWNRLGRVQAASNARVFEKILKKAEPEARTWEFYSRKYQYYLGRKENKKALETLREAIEKGKKLSNPELVVFASCRLADYCWRHGEREKALDLARKNNAYAVENVHSGQKIARKAGYSNGTQARMEAASQLLHILEEMKIPGWKREWERVARREFLDGQTFLLYHFLYRQRRMDKNYTMSAGDTIFKTLCGETFQKRYGFCYEAHAVRLAAVPYKSWLGDNFEECLQKTLNGFEKYKRSKDEKPWMLSGFSFYNAPHEAERKALLAKYLFDRYPEAFKSQLAASLPARNYEEGKTLLEKYWNSGKMEPRDRRQALADLLKKAPSQSERQWCERELNKLGKWK
ncbi:MAG: hypothetical protein WC082_02355 [Victivallales bacterium]